MSNVAITLFGASLALLSLPYTWLGFRLPEVGQLLLYLVGTYAIGVLGKRGILPWTLILLSLASGCSLCIHILGQPFNVTYISYVYRHFLVGPLCAVAVGYLTNISCSPLVLAWSLVPAGILNAVVAYLSFARTPLTVTAASGVAVGGGGRITLNYLDPSEPVFVTGLTLAASPLAAVCILQLASALRSPSGSLREHVAAGFQIISGILAGISFVFLGVYLGTRGGVFAFLLGSCIVGVFHIQSALTASRFWAVATFLAALLCCLGLFRSSLSLEHFAFLDRFTISQMIDKSASGRDNIWASQMSYLLARPLGAGAKSDGFNAVDLSAHNLILDLGTMLGIPFAVCVTAACAMMINAAVLFTLKAKHITFATGCIIIAISYVIYGMIESVATVSYTAFLVMAMSFGLVASLRLTRASGTAQTSSEPQDRD